MSQFTGSSAGINHGARSAERGILAPEAVVASFEPDDWMSGVYAEATAKQCKAAKALALTLRGFSKKQVRSARLQGESGSIGAFLG